MVMVPVPALKTRGCAPLIVLVLPPKVIFSLPAVVIVTLFELKRTGPVMDTAPLVVVVMLLLISA